MTEKQIKSWERWRARGKVSYILMIGLTWGFILALLFPFIDLAINATLSIDAFTASILSIEGLIRTLVFLFAGIFFGWGMWVIGEKKYKTYADEL